MVEACLLVASQVLVLDQGIEILARGLLPVLSERPLVPGLGLVWQTADPGRNPSSGLLTVWIAVSVIVIIGLATVVSRTGPRFTAIQALAMGLILGGSASHLVDLLHWGDVVATLHLTTPAVEAFTGIARLAQWSGLGLLLVAAVGRRRAVS
jgi:lipoprotein signal peptidase